MGVEEGIAVKEAKRVGEVPILPVSGLGLTTD
jgi:hypothetical protein